MQLPNGWQSKRAGRNPGKSGLHKAEALRDVDPSGEADCMIPRCQEKPLVRLPVTVPKPTQVDEKSILRRSGEPPLRNSTK